MTTAARRVLWPLMIILAVVALVWATLPIRTFFEQNQVAAQVKGEIRAIEAENDEMRTRIEALQSKDRIEEIARRDFNFVYPGEEAYVILPPPPDVLVLPGVWPFTVLADNLDD